MQVGSKNPGNLSTFVFMAATLVLALERQTVRAADAPNYPHVNLAICYEVDAKWPHRPDGVAWADMPGVAVDKGGNVWAFTRANPPVQVYDPSGKFVRGWGEGLIASAHFMRIDHQGHVWLADNKNHVVLECTPEGKVLRELGVRGEPGCDERHFNRPTDMAVAPTGDVFVSDGYGNNRIVHVDPSGKFVKAWGKLGVGPGEFSLPHSIVRDSQGRLYLADRNNARVQVFDESGKFLTEWRNLLVPWGLSISDRDEIWACGCSPMSWTNEQINLSCPPKDQLVMKFDTSGRVLSLWTIPKGKDGKEEPGDVNWIHAVAVDAQGNLYVGDIKGRRLQKFARLP